ncbi:LysR family transcriptional regulator [Acetobacter tropicalis]|uniref:LysR family transcriptional regulator n=1 Tax=Acetobacter tropicalis TaxID=104102 RepID=A0A252ABV3_9PROT|nr:LysR family transcriptional regulator [Acetobacter tropicalis]OUI87062.1 LysR family transcriptional regulator [Acetobacter tropicalis]
MNVSLDQLQSFVTAAEKGSFSAAARLLGKAQSAISTQISNLEVDLGLMLFDRSGRQPVLTQAGLRLLPEARVVLERREHLIGVAHSLEEQVENKLAVAIDQLYPEHALGTIFSEFAKNFPYVQVEILFPLMEDVGQLVLEGVADLGVMWQQDHPQPELAFQAIGYVPLKLVCGRTHPLAHRQVTWEDLKRYRQILVATRGREQTRQSLRVAADVWWVESHWVILEMVKHNIGWAFVSDHVLAASPTAPDIVAPNLQFDAGERLTPLVTVWHKKHPHGPAAQWLRNRLRQGGIPGVTHPSREP